MRKGGRKGGEGDLDKDDKNGNNDERGLHSFDEGEVKDVL